MRLLIFLFFFNLTACSHYQGLGNLQSQGDYNAQAAPHSPHAYNSPYKNPEQKGPLYLSWPVAKIKISQRFNPSNNPYHEGLDLSGRKNTAIYAAHSGLVVYSGSGFKGYGKMVLLEFNNTWATLYGHFNHIYVKSGDWVKRGQLIGRMGRTGRANGVHLHFELLQNKQPIDPLRYLPPRSQFTRK